MDLLVKCSDYKINPQLTEGKAYRVYFEEASGISREFNCVVSCIADNYVEAVYNHGTITFYYWSDGWGDRVEIHDNNPDDYIDRRRVTNVEFTLLVPKE